MHRVPAGTFERLSSPKGLWQAWLACRRGKRRRPTIAAFYLDGLDHSVERELKVRGYLRYMDDFVLFGDDPDRLEAIRGRVSQWLGQERRLRLKDPDAPVRSTRERSTFLGFRVSRAGVGLGPKARRRLKRALAQADAMGTRRLIQVLRSYQGLIRSLGP